MQLVRPQSLSALVTVALAAGAVTGAGALASPASAEGAAPTGAYVLNTTSIWAAQTALLTQTALADDVDAAETITRVVDWGDGTEAETIPAGTTKLRHAYESVGTFTVSVRLTDSEGNAATATVTGPSAVKVAATPGTFKVKVGAPWVGPYGSTVATISLAGIPANVSRVKIYWGDGNYSTEKRSATVSSWYYRTARSYKVTVALETADGESAPKAAGTIVAKPDGSPPNTQVSTPKNPHKAASWKSVSGTSVDKGAGAEGVDLFFIQQRGQQLYYYAFKSAKWIKIAENAPVPAGGLTTAKVTKNKWKVNVKGVAKGWLDVYYLGFDKIYNGPTDYKYKTFTITK